MKYIRRFTSVLTVLTLFLIKDDQERDQFRKEATQDFVYRI